MALYEMPNGEFVDIDDAASPEVVASIRKQYSGSPRKSRAPGTRRKDAVKKGGDIRSGGLYNVPVVGSLLRGLDDLTEGSKRGVTLSFNDEIEGAGGAVMGQGYAASRDAARERGREASDRSPFLYGAGEIGSGLAMPVGLGVKAAQGAGNVAGRLGMDKAAQALNRAGEFAQSGGAIRQGVTMGAGYGAVNAAGSADEIGDVPEALLSGGALGAATGGALGGALHGARRGLQTLNDTGPEAAKRAAFSRIAKLGENAGYTPEQLEQIVKAANELGGDFRVVDATRGLQAQGTSLARKPDVPGSEDLINVGIERSAGRRNRFSEQVREQSGVNEDGLLRGETMRDARKAQSQVDYREGGALDNQIEWSDDLNKFFQEAPDADKFVRNAYTNAMRFGDDVGRIASESGQVIPSMRAFDYLKREFDDAIGAALKRGEKQLASGLSNQLNRLKGIIADANPQYTQVLASQRDAFQIEKALELGEGTLRRLTTEPRKLLKEVRNMTPAERNEWRIGFIDSLVNWERRGDPIKVFRDAMAVDAQRKVLEAAFGGKGNLGRMERWINRESKSALTDAKVSGPQAITSEALLAEGGDAVPTRGDVIKNAFRGWGFGGIAGAAGNVLGTLGRMANGTNRLTQEEIIKILMSKGDNLVAGTQAAAAYAAKRGKNNELWARTAAKAGQQPFTDALGD